MLTREIPRESWTEFFDGFSRRHEGWLATVQVLGGVGAQTEAEELPLVGIAADRDGVSVLLGGESAETNASRIVPSPVRIRVEEGGAVDALEIETKEGETTLVIVRPSQVPAPAGEALPEKIGSDRGEDK
jgi:Family of unknown function (DUF5335)